jgi:Flp pilus assembly protein TadG
MTGPVLAGRRERGNAALELIILAPVIILMICMMIAAGRLAIAHGSVSAAARDAARQASIERSPQAAQAAAFSSAASTLAAENLNCTPSISLNTSQFARPVGQPAVVSATVRCRVSLSDLILPGLPGSVMLHATFTSPLDPYRGRT